MRLDLLLKRENFPIILKNTLENYFSNAYNWKGKVVFQNGKKNRSLCSFIVNHKLNIIYSKKFDRGLLKSLASQYEYNPNLFRRFLQKIYITLSTAEKYEFLFTKFYLRVDPWAEYFEHLCIIPGNNSIKILDSKNYETVVILKDGFSEKFFFNELQLRNNFSFLTIPKLLKEFHVHNYYIEELVIGMPCNRIADEKLKLTSIIQSKKELFNLYEKTKKEVLVKEHLSGLLKELNIAIDNLPSPYSDLDKEEIHLLIEFIKKPIKAFIEKSFYTVQSHGDFQMGNIFVSSGVKKVYLIDWEYTERRSIFYDSLVLALNTRSPKGLGKRINRIFQNKDNLDWAWCMGLKNQVQTLELWMLSVFLLEDLLIRLSELQIPLLKSYSNGLSIWKEEIMSIGEVLDE